MISKLKLVSSPTVIAYIIFYKSIGKTISLRISFLFNTLLYMQFIRILNVISFLGAFHINANIFAFNYKISVDMQNMRDFHILYSKEFVSTQTSRISENNTYEMFWH